MKKQKMNKGITLIALIITIIVLLILAAVAIAAIKGDGIISHAKNAKSQYSGAQENEQDMLGRYEYELEKAQDKTSGSYEQYVWDEAQKNGIVPNGAIYKTGYSLNADMTFNDSNVVTLNSGDKLPTKPQYGDIFIYGDYEYGYNMWWCPGGWYKNDTDTVLWGVAVKDTSRKKQELSEILSSILGEKINPDFQYTWYGCNNLINLNIPDGCTRACFIGGGRKITLPNSLEAFTFDPGWRITVEEIYYKGTKEQWKQLVDNTSKKYDGMFGTTNQEFIIHYENGINEKVKFEAEYDETTSKMNFKWTYTAI